MIEGLRKEQLQKKLTVQLNGLTRYIVDENAQFRTDASRTAEDVFCELFNTALSCELVNLNQGKQAPGLDLGDKKSGLCFQITAEASPSKVRDTLEHCKSENYGSVYSKIRILFISTKKLKLTDVDLQGKTYDFLDKVDLLNITKLISELSGLASERLEAVVDYLDKELLQAPDETDIPIIGEIIDYAVENAQSAIDHEYSPDTTKLLKVNEKIKINFESEGDRDAVRKYMERAMTCFDLINTRLEIEDTDQQDALHIYMQYLYNKHKPNSTPIDTLQAMIEAITPKNKTEDLRYLHWSMALVMFYFDDCSIFERTAEEKQTSIFGAVS